MRGILWRWLFFFGAIFWISLCLADYHQKYLQRNYKETLKTMEIQIEPPAPPQYYPPMVPQKRKLQPPTPSLTIWKFLSIIFSVGAIVIIKRLSTFRKKRLPVVSCSDFDLMRPPYGPLITSIPPIGSNPYNVPIYPQEFQIARFEAGLNAGDTKPTALLGVKIVQKKLEDLENNIATLKQRISNKSASTSTSVATEPPKIAAHQSYFGPVISNSPVMSTIESSGSSLKISDPKSSQKENSSNSRPVTPISMDLTAETLTPNTVPITTSTISKAPTSSTPEKSTRKSAGSSSPSKESSKETKDSTKDSKESKEVRFDLKNDIISLKQLKESMSTSGKDLNTEPKKIGSINIAEIQESYEKMKNDLSQIDFKFNSIQNEANKRRKSQKKSRSQIESKTLLESNTTCPSITSHKSHDGSSKSFPMDGSSSTKMYTDSNSTNSLVSIRKKRLVKPAKERIKDLKSMKPLSTSLATYFQSPLLKPRTNKYDPSESYAAIQRKRLYKKYTKDPASLPAKLKEFDSSSNESTDSIDKFVAKILKHDSEMTMPRNSSDELSMASTSISSLTDSSSTFISGSPSKFDSVTNSIRSILPLSHTTVSSNLSLSGISRNLPAGAAPLSSGESIVAKKTKKHVNSNAIHSLALNYLQKLDNSNFESDSKEKIHDSESEFSFTTKSVLEKYKSKTKQSSAASSRQNILEDKYWLLHW